MNSTGRNVGLLAACQAMLFTNNTTLVAINGLAGLALTPVKALATLPVTCWILGSAIATMPASLHMKRVGRRRGLTLGVLWGIAGALLCAAAMSLQSFWLLCFGALVWGVFNAYGQYYRFAAADAASAEFRSTAISLVLAGGLVGGILGPGVSRWTIDLFDVRFMGAYLSLIAFALVAVALLQFIRIPAPSASEQSAAGRPLLEIAAQPRLIVASIGIALSGISVAQFSWALVLLGVGWNFLYISGTTLLTQTYRPEERAKAQGANDQAIFVMMAVSSLASGLTVTTVGWERVNLLALPLVALMAAAIAWFALQERSGKAATA